MHKEIESNTKVKTQLWKYCESHKHMFSTSNQAQCRHSWLEELRTLQYGQKDQKSTKHVPSTAPRPNVDRLYLPSSEGGKGLPNLEECVSAEKRSLGQYLKMNEDEWLRSAWKEGLIKEDEDLKVYKEKTSKFQMEEWKSKPMQGQFLRQTKELSSNDTWQWLQRGELKKETEGIIMAAQDQSLRTRYIQRAIDGTSISPKCRQCNQKCKSINHIACECPALAQNQYKKRHDSG